jgi:hypothetical protein
MSQLQVYEKIPRILCFIIPTDVCFKPNALQWNEMQPEYRKLFLYVQSLVGLIGAQKLKRHKKKKPNKSKSTSTSSDTSSTESSEDEMDEEEGEETVRFGFSHSNGNSQIDTAQTAKLKPLFYVQPLERNNSKIPYYVIHIMLRGMDKDILDAIAVSLDDLDHRARKDLTIRRQDMILDEGFANGASKFGGTQIRSGFDLKRTLGLYMKGLPPRKLEEAGLYQFSKDSSLDSVNIEKMFHPKTARLFLEAMDVKLNAFDAFYSGYRDNKLTVNEEQLKLSLTDTIRFIDGDRKLPHCDEKYVTLINTIYDFRNVPTIEGQVAYAIGSGKDDIMSIAACSDNGKRKYNNIFGLIRNYNDPAFRALEDKFSECQTYTQLAAKYAKDFKTYTEEKRDLFIKTIEPSAPQKVKSLYPQAVGALLNWMHIHRKHGDGVRFFHKKPRETVNGVNTVPHPFRSFDPEYSSIENFQRWMLQVVNNVDYSAPQNNTTVLCCFDGCLGQFSDDSGERLYFWLVGPPAASKSFILEIMQILMIAETWCDMDDIGSEHNNTTQTRRTGTTFVMDEGHSVLHSKDSRNRDELSRLKTMLTKNRLERTAMAFDETKKERHTIQHSSEMKITLIASSNHPISDPGLRDRFVTFNVVPSNDPDLISDLKIAKTMENTIGKQAHQEFKNFTNDLLACCALTHLAMTQRVQYPVDTLSAQVMIAKMVDSVRNSNLMVEIDKRHVTRCVRAASYLTVAKSWLDTYASVGSPGYGKSWSPEMITEAAKRQCCDVSCTVSAFCHMFESFQDPLVKATTYSISQRLWPFKQRIERQYKKLYGIDYTMDKLNYDIHPVLLWTDLEEKSHNIGFSLRRVIVNGVNCVDMNYGTLTASNKRSAVEMLCAGWSNMYVYLKEDVHAWLSTKDKYRMRPKKVFKYIPESDIKTLLGIQSGNKTQIMKKIKAVRDAYPGETIDETLVRIFDESSDVLEYVGNEEQFHSNYNKVYVESEGLPMIRYDTDKNSSCVKISFLLEMFRVDPVQVLENAIKSLSDFMAHPRNVLMTYRDTQTKVTIPAATGVPSMQNYRKKRRTTETDILAEMHESIATEMVPTNGDDDEEFDEIYNSEFFKGLTSDSVENPSMDDSLLSDQYKQQIVKQDKIYFGGMSIDRYLAVKHLERYGVFGSDIQQYIPDIQK